MDGEKIVELDVMKTRCYLERAIDTFLRDPPDTEFQCGFLAALTLVYQEALAGIDSGRLAACDKHISEFMKWSRDEDRVVPFSRPELMQ